MNRNDKPFPEYLDLCICSYLKYIWEKGWLNNYSEEHFLIKVIEKRLNSFNWYHQFINNDINMYNIVSDDGSIDYDMLCENFCYNFSSRLKNMALIFGESQIKKFVIDQLSAGKNNYDENAFFQAFSEIEILCFLNRGFDWKEVKYEPTTRKHGVNPEASFIGEFYCKASEDIVEVKVNVEVKTPQFPDLRSRNDKKIIPTILLTPSGRKEIANLCEKSDVECIAPRITKLVEFINSAATKFNYPEKNEYNILYINWSYCDFPSNGFLEAWSLLTNKYNGILTHPGIGTTLPLREPVDPEAYKKITAIIVYTSALEQLMFCNFTHVWQRTSAGCKFRMYVLDERLRDAELNGNSDILFQLTGMKPADEASQILMVDYNLNSIDDAESCCKFCEDVYDIMIKNALSSENK